MVINWMPISRTRKECRRRLVAVQEIFGVNRHIRSVADGEWGLIGSPGTVRHQVFSSVELTEAALAKHLKIKTRRGYPPDAAKADPSLISMLYILFCEATPIATIETETR